MDNATIKHLNNLNRAFYEHIADSFHETRRQAWGGWHALLPHLKAPLSILDIGCGNGRFALFLAEHLGENLTYHGLDNSPALLAHAKRSLSQTACTFKLDEFDLLNDPLPQEKYDLVVLFGVLHHIPSYTQRQNLMREIAGCVRENGLLAFACWCFYESERFRQRIISWPPDTLVEKHDYLLDWQHDSKALRYCHYVDEQEHQALIEATGLSELETFRADGNLNRYSILHSVEKS